MGLKSDNMVPPQPGWEGSMASIEVLQNPGQVCLNSSQVHWNGPQGRNSAREKEREREQLKMLELYGNSPIYIHYI